MTRSRGGYGLLSIGLATVIGASLAMVGAAATPAASPFAVPLIEFWDGRSWQQQSGPNPNGAGSLTTVAALSATDAWALGSYGLYQYTGGVGALAEHWDGSSWQQVTMPAPSGATEVHLDGVAAVSATSVWAVGSWADATGAGSATLIEHWDGSSWTIIPSPSPGRSAQLSGIVAPSATDVWAVGYSDPRGNGLFRTLVLHWNGTTWERVSSPNPGHEFPSSQLSGIAAVSPRSVWAVGTFSHRHRGHRISETLILHWNGEEWEHVPSPTPGASGGLSAATALARTDVWAVGRDGSGRRRRALVEHWNGRTWRVVQANAGYANSAEQALTSLAAATDHDVWAVGFHQDGGTLESQTLGEHWDGNAWSRVSSPNPARDDWFSEIAAATPAAVWAVGTYYPAAIVNQPLEISRSSLRQDGKHLVWRLELAKLFSLDALTQDGRTLCLLIEGVSSASVRGQACLGGSARHPGRLRLVYERVTAAGPGPSQAVRAKITESSGREMTARFLPSQVGVGYRPLRWQVSSTLSPPPCAPVRPAGGRCNVLVPAHASRLLLHPPQPVGCAPSGPSEVFSGRAHLHEIALTFDDGPGSEPRAIEFVNLLAREHVPATFFEVGDEIAAFDPGGSVERAMLADGDMIGDHSWSHPYMTALPERAQRAQLEQTVSAIRRRTGFTPCLWRPPYGDSDRQLVSVARSLGMLTIMWDVDPRDWALPGANVIYRRVVSAAHNGAIVIQHFGGGPRYQTLAALRGEIATLRSEGYRFVTVTQLLGLKLIYR